MEALIKTFLQKTSLNTLTAISFAAGSISLKLTFLDPFLQFIFTALTVSIFSVSFHKFLSSPKKFNKVLSTFSIFTGLILIFANFGSVLVVILVLSGYFAVNYLRNLYISTITAHICDMISTWILLPWKREANIFVRRAIEEFGVFEGVLASKIVLIGLPLVYSYKYFKAEEESIFLKIVFVIGLSMALRNLFIYTAN